MSSPGSSIAAILVATAFFLMGNGLIGTLTPLRAHAAGFSDIAIGALGAWYYLGFVAGCVVGPRLLSRVGHIRAFSVAAVLIAAATLVQPLSPNTTVWFAARAVTGLCMAILYMSVESWLNDRASNTNRGRLLSLYVVVNLSALLLGQWLLLLGDPQSYELFSIGAIAYCICVVPMGLTRLPAPAARERPRIDIPRLLSISPVGAAGCVTVGLANGAFWTLAPIYGQSLGFTTRDIALFMSVFIAGGALVQWPLGRISDGMDRRWMIAAICSAASVSGLILGALGWYLFPTGNLFYAVVFVLGATMLPLYSLSIAHANDRLPRAEFVDASAGLLMITAAASIPGPLLASFVIATAGPFSLFIYTALVHAAMAFYAFTRMRMKEPAPFDTRDLFSPVPQSSPAALPLDPRGPQQEKPL